MTSVIGAGDLYYFKQGAWQSTSADWRRPSDWLRFTIPGSSEQKFVGLVAVFDQGSNYIALRCSVSSGTYTVDWGDGSSPVTVSSNTRAEYNYSYSSLSSSTTSSRGYRQAIVTVTPTTAGATFSAVRLDERHSARSSTNTVAPWLDVAISAPNAATVVVSSTGSRAVLLSMLEQAIIVSHNRTSFAWMFEDCYSLQSVYLPDVSGLTSCNGMFFNCWSLEVAPLFDTQNVTTMGDMFYQCRSLRSVPLYNTQNVTSMSQMFYACFVLPNIPAFNTQNVTNMNAMLIDTYSLSAVPILNTSKVTNFSNFVSFGRSLRQIDELNLGAVSSAGNNNMGLTSHVSLGRAKMNNMRWTLSFSGCMMAAAQLDEMYTALAKLNPNVTNVTGSGTVVTYTVDDITAFVANRTVTITGVSPVAYNLTNATVATVNAANKQFTVNNAATGTYVSGGVAALQDNRTITVTGNPGTTGDDPTIATNKGWSVSGS